MAKGFLYFVPTTRRALSENDLGGFGLAHIASGKGVGCGFTSAGPAGREGLVLSVNPIEGQGPDPLYQPDRQIWAEVPADGERATYWIGYAKDEPKPGPDDLRREKVLAGETVMLLDGSEWMIPIALSGVRSTSLPKGLVLDTDFKTWKAKTLPKYLRICTLAGEVWNAFRSATADTVSIGTERCIEIAIEALAINYRVSKVEASLLGLLSTESMIDILRALIDQNAVEAVVIASQKKRESSLNDSSTTNSGDKDGSPTTPQRSQI